MKSILATRLKEERLSSKLTQQEVVDIINAMDSNVNLSRNSISRYENGTRIPSIDILSNLALIFEVSVDYLIGKINKKFDPNNSLEPLNNLVNEISAKDDDKINLPLSSIIDYAYRLISISYKNDFISDLDVIFSKINFLFFNASLTNKPDDINDLKDALNKVMDSKIQKL